MSDPELLPIRPRCPNCQVRMKLADFSTSPEGFERRAFECAKCRHSEIMVVATDPLRSDAVGWTKGELRPAENISGSHEIQNGRLVRKQAE